MVRPVFNLFYGVNKPRLDELTEFKSDSRAETIGGSRLYARLSKFFSFKLSISSELARMDLSGELLVQCSASSCYIFAKALSLRYSNALLRQSLGSATCYSIMSVVMLFFILLIRVSLR